MLRKEILEEKNMYDLERRIKFKEEVGYNMKGHVKVGLNGRYSCLMVKEIGK